MEILELPPTVPVRGRLVDAVGGGPVAGAWLWVGRGSHHFREVDPRGSFSLRLPARKDATLSFGAPGYLSIAYPAPPLRTACSH